MRRMFMIAVTLMLVLGGVVAVSSWAADEPMTKTQGDALRSRSQGGDDIFRIDPATNALTPVHVGQGGSTCLVAQDDAVWVSNDNSGTVTRIDPATNQIAAVIRVGNGPADGAVGPDGLVWVPNLRDGTVSRIDPADNLVVDTIPVVAGPFVLRSAYGDVWIGDFAGTTVWRLHVPPR